MRFPSHKSFIDYLYDIRLWLVASVVLHLFGISEPPLEPGTTWRQTDGLMIARNFYERSPNIFYPITDVAGAASGIVGCEFPLFNYLIYLVSLPFGFHDWFGRLINVFISTIGVYFFYQTIRQWFNERAALFAGIILLVSLWFTYSRTSIPDTFAASLNLVAIYFGIRYLMSSLTRDLLLFFFLAACGCLSKISSASLLTVLIIPLCYGTASVRHKIIFCAVSFVILIQVCAWYFWWVPYLNKTYGMEGHFFMGMGFSEGARVLIDQWPETLRRFYLTSMKISGFIVFIASLCWLVIRKRSLAVYSFLIPFVAFTIIVVKIALGFNIDAYYVIMYLPPMAFVAGLGLSELKRKHLGLVIGVVIVIEGVANQIHEFDLRVSQAPWLTLEAALDKVSTRTDRIAITGQSTDDPMPMYMAHRRGWVMFPQDLADRGSWDQLKIGGCKLVVFAKAHGEFWPTDVNPAFESEDFIIFNLNPVAR